MKKAGPFAKLAKKAWTRQTEEVGGQRRKHELLEAAGRELNNTGY